MGRGNGATLANITVSLSTSISLPHWMVAAEVLGVGSLILRRDMGLD